LVGNEEEIVPEIVPEIVMQDQFHLAGCGILPRPVVLAEARQAYHCTA